MEKKKIQATIIADSVNEFGHRITSLVCTFPRFILAELNTHRVFSRNSASSRAVPSKKMIQMVEDDPFIPIAWQKEHSGMQGTEYFTDTENDLPYLIGSWKLQAKHACDKVRELIDCFEKLDGTSEGITKQLANRLLEPFMWHTCIITSTEWENFFNLRCPQYSTNNKDFYKSRKEYIQAQPEELKGAFELMDDLSWLMNNKGAAEIHMMILAECIYDAINESEPKKLVVGEWHIPFGDNISTERLLSIYNATGKGENIEFDSIDRMKIKIATARCARVSYINYEGKDDYEADLELFNRLSKSRNTGVFHASPFEHCARAMGGADMGAYYTVENGVTKMGQCRNFRGFIQLRVLMES